MKKTIKRIIGTFAALAVAAVFFSGCGSKTVVIREQASTTTTQYIPTTTAAPVERMSVSEAIAMAQESQPGLYIYTDAQMISLMQTACDSLDQWNGDYVGFIENARVQLSGETATMIAETSTLVTAATFSLCTEHQAGLLAALEADNY
jgi:hypothetical protein